MESGQVGMPSAMQNEGSMDVVKTKIACGQEQPHPGKSNPAHAFQ